VAVDDEAADLFGAFVAISSPEGRGCQPLVVLNLELVTGTKQQ
jgi:hypothetical protein